LTRQFGLSLQTFLLMNIINLYFWNETYLKELGAVTKIQKLKMNCSLCYEAKYIAILGCLIILILIFYFHVT